MFSYNQDITLPLLSPQASAHAGHLQPTHHPPSACMCFSPGPVPLKLSTDGHRAVRTCVGHSASMRQSYRKPRDRRIRGGVEGQGGLGTCRKGDGYIISELAVQERDSGERTNEPTSRLCCIVWLRLPGYLYVSLLQRRKPLLLDPDVRGRTDSSPTERWQPGPSGGSAAAAELLCCHSGDSYFSPL